MLLSPLNENQSPQIQPIISDKVKPDSKGELLSGKELSESEDEPAPECMGEEFASREEVLNAIEEAYKRTKNLQVKLLNFARKKIIEEMGKKADERLTTEDIVSEAIYRISIGKRKWYKNRVEKIENLILMVIVSLIRIESAKRPDEDNPLYNEIEAGIESVKKKPKPRIIPLYKEFDKKEVSSNSVAETESTKNNNKDSYDSEFDFESKGLEDYIEEVEDALDNDEIAFYVFQARLNGMRSNIDIANDLGVDVKEVENALKRLRRILLKITKNN